jgi:hypothetical protein
VGLLKGRLRAGHVLPATHEAMPVDLVLIHMGGKLDQKTRFRASGEQECCRLSTLPQARGR